MIVADREYVMGKYKLHKLKDIEELVAQAVEVNIPFNNPITGFCAFTHKAGIHAKAILNNPSTYEIINPADFGAGLVLVLMRQRPGTANTPVFLTSFAATVTSIGQDITEHKALEERKMRFMAVVSHELRSPIHGICGLSDTMAGNEEDPKRKKMLKMITSCSMRLL